MNGDTGKDRSVSIIRKEMKKWEKRLEALEREYRRMPEGEILIIKKGGRYCCYVYRDRQVKSIRKDCRSTGRLMRKRILGYEIAIAKAFCSVLSSAEAQLAASLESIEKNAAVRTLERIRQLPEGDMYLLSPDEYKWKYDDYPQNNYKMENLRYATGRGVRVRSKSEKFIGSKLEEYHIAYRYEARLFIDDKIYYPDFTIMTGDGRIILWEHFGMMEDSEYFMRAYRKIEAYRRIGHVQHSNLICTYESDIADGSKLDEIIERFILE